MINLNLSVVCYTYWLSCLVGVKSLDWKRKRETRNQIPIYKFLLPPGFYFLIFATILERVKTSQANDCLMAFSGTSENPLPQKGRFQRKYIEGLYSYL